MDARTNETEDHEPAISSQREFWNRWLLENRERIPDHLRAQAELVHKLIGTLKLDAPRILEIGCGTGWLSCELTDYGYLTGTDLSDAAIAQARTKLPNAKFIAGDFLAVDLGADPFDVAVTVETLSHIVNKEAFVEKASSLLRENGYLILTTQNRFVFERASEGRVSPQSEGKVSQWVTMSELRRLLRPSFRILSAETINPSGHGGILRVINSTKLNRIVCHFVSEQSVRRLKERAGLGETIVVLAQRI